VDFRAIIEIARQELTANIRNRWTVMFAVVFGILVVGVAVVGIRIEGYDGVQNLTRTSASMLNLVLYIVPLIALVMGTLSFTGEKGSAELLFSQPVLRSEVVLGKWLGLLMSLAVSTLTGFFAAGGIILATTGGAGMIRYIGFVLLSLQLATVFLTVAVLVSVLNRRKGRAFGVSLFLWFFFVLFYDLLALGTATIIRGETANMFLFVSLLGNPVDMVRVSALIVLDNETIFGAAGAALIRFFGGEVSSLLYLLSGLCVWTFIPMLASIRLLRTQDL
jgi:Cu-processing system permease protein